MAHFRVYWRRQRKGQRLPELNSFPATPQAYYDGHYPGSVAVKVNRSEFNVEFQKPPEFNVYPQTPSANQYPAFVLEAANNSSFTQTHQELPELNTYPATPIGYYSGFYPGSALAKVNRVWFRRKHQAVELNEYPETIDFVPSVPGLEFTLPSNRLHFAIPNNQLHYDIVDNKLHYTIEGDGVGTAPQRQPASVGAERNAAISYVKDLDEGELLTGIPLVTEDTTTDLTITNKSVSTEVLIINGESVPIGGAVQCHITGFVSANFPYTLNVIAVTDSTPPQTLPGTIIIEESL